ncbi:helix-turn-helix domain-containing protein [Aquimarina spinulae]|uniref:helix-turn-helix domain-containing protein n=1 Tax=Aquimarina spinulae TaxID=1192023 RepID=UPI00190006E9|nr:helix-turn-helix transcriptional regulator [Aquimarina spinulae]
MKVKDHNYIIAFGKHLRSLRKKNKLSQERLANDADIPISQVGRIERGEVNTTLSTMRALSKALKIHITELFDFDND